MNKKTIQYGVAGIGVAVLLGGIVQFLVNERLEDFLATVTLQQSEQRVLLVGIAETTARNGADAVTEAVVKDCSTTERDRFDKQLGRLDAGLSRAELVELDALFSSCGSFFAERKSLMVARMKREFDLYESYTEQLEVLRATELDKESKVEEWRALVELEARQNELFTSLVTLQGRIIDELLAGNTINSPEMTEILAEVREVRENLTLAGTQASSVRSEVLSL